MTRWVIGALVLSAGASASSVARADTNDAAVVAQKLFEDARALMEAGRLDEACPKLAESQRLDPGIGTMLNLAICYERQGRTASAWATYADVVPAARRAGQRERAEFASKRVAALEVELAFLTVIAESAPGLVVSRNGAVLTGASFGVALPVDPGDQLIEASAPGFVSYRQATNVPPRARVAVVVPSLQPVVPTAAADATADAPRAVDARAQAQRIFGFSLAGAGLLTASVGGFFGLRASSAYGEAEREHCTEVDCDARGLALIDRARREANLATVLLIAGATFGVGGTVLALTAKPEQPTTKPMVRVELGPRSAGVSGAF